MNEPIEVLDTLLDPSRLEKRARRLEILLKDPAGATGKGWSFFIPPCFNDALNLRLTEIQREGKKTQKWTQGSNFAFKRGDVLYDCREGYGNWLGALKAMESCMQVVSARDVNPTTKERKRDPGHVSAVVFRPDKKRVKLERVEELKLTQDEFVRFLILGKVSPSA